MTFTQYIVFTEDMYESAVNDNAEDFPKVAVDAYPTLVIGVKFVSTFVDWGDQVLVPNIGEDALSVSLFLIIFLSLHLPFSQRGSWSLGTGRGRGTEVN